MLMLNTSEYVIISFVCILVFAAYVGDQIEVFFAKRSPGYIRDRLDAFVKIKKAYEKKSTGVTAQHVYTKAEESLHSILTATLSKVDPTGQKQKDYWQEQECVHSNIRVAARQIQHSLEQWLAAASRNQESKTEPAADADAQKPDSSVEEFQQRRRELASTLSEARLGVDQINALSLTQWPPSDKSTRLLLRVQSANVDLLIQAKELFVILHEILIENIKKEAKLGREEIRDRKKLVFILGSEIVELVQQNSRIKPSKENENAEDTENRAIRRTHLETWLEMKLHPILKSMEDEYTNALRVDGKSQEPTTDTDDILTSVSKARDNPILLSGSTFELGLDKGYQRYISSTVDDFTIKFRILIPNMYSRPGCVTRICHILGDHGFVHYDYHPKPYCFKRICPVPIHKTTVVKNVTVWVSLGDVSDQLPWRVNNWISDTEPLETRQKIAYVLQHLPSGDTSFRALKSLIQNAYMGELPESNRKVL